MSYRCMCGDPECRSCGTAQGTFTIDDIADLRGGCPKQCDFCGQPYTDSRTAIPEEAGLWTCTECWDRWEKEDAALEAKP